MAGFQYVAALLNLDLIGRNQLTNRVDFPTPNGGAIALLTLRRIGNRHQYFTLQIHLT